LVELLVVVALIGILTALALPSLQGLQRSGGFNKNVFQLADDIHLARTYAMSESSYVYLGLTEIDRNQNPGASPQVAGVGKVIVGMVGTTDGTSNNATTNLTQLRPPQVLDMLYIASSLPAGTSGGMARPSTNVSNYEGGSSIFLSPFALPPGSALNAGKYNFSTSIAFNPQGAVTATGSAVQWAEIDLQPYSGNPAAPANATGNQAALIIDGATGAVTVYRP